MSDYDKISDMLIAPSKITGADMGGLASTTSSITVSCGTKWCQRYRRMSKRRRRKALHLELVRALNSLIGKPFNQDTHDEAVVLVNGVLDRVLKPVTVTLSFPTPPRS